MSIDSVELLCYSGDMKMMVQVKLQATSAQTIALKRTIETANHACNHISGIAWEKKTFGQYQLHRLVYKDVRAKFGLSAQVAVGCIAKVAAAYKRDKKRKSMFKPMGAIHYDDRILSWQITQSQVSIWTINGRIKIPFVCSQRQGELLKNRCGESNLVFFRNQFYLYATYHVDEPEPVQSQGVLGIDLGIVNLAVDSDGHVYAGNTVNGVRHRHRRLRTKLQKRGTHSAKRLLKKLSGKEARFARQVNHTISKQAVKLAQDTQRDIAIENLSGIRERITVRRNQRAALHSWSFSQLREFLEYKSKLAGISLITVDPRNTSRTCPKCGYVDKRNRPTQSVFSYVICGYSGFADEIAARNIASRAAVNQPNAARDEAKTMKMPIIFMELRQSVAASHSL